MFDNIGPKVMMLAFIECWVGIIGAIISGVVLIAGGSLWIGLLTVVLGSLLSWVGAWITYAIGAAAEDAAVARAKSEEALKKLQAMETMIAPAPAATPTAPRTAMKAMSAPAPAASTAPAESTAAPRTVVSPGSIPPGKKVCPHCGLRNNTKNTVCFACGKEIN